MPLLLTSRCPHRHSGLSRGWEGAAGSDRQWVLWLLAAPNHPHGRTVLLGQSLEIPEFLKLLFSLQHMLQTRHAPGEAANKSVSWLLGGFGGEISRKSPAPSPPATPWHWGESSAGLFWVPNGANGLIPQSPNIGGFAWSFLRGCLNLRLFMA